MDTRIINFVRSRASIDITELVRGLSAEGQLVTYEAGEGALAELEHQGVVGRTDANGRRPVLKPASRGDIGILTHQRVTQLLSRLDPRVYNVEFGTDFVKISNSEANFDKIFYELRDLEEFCHSQMQVTSTSRHATEDLTQIDLKADPEERVLISPTEPSPRSPKLAALMDDAEADVLAYMGFPAQHRAKLHSTDEIDKPFRRELLFLSGTGDRAAKSRDRGCEPDRAAFSVVPHLRHPCAASWFRAAAIG